MRTQKRVLMLLQSDFPPDVRVEKEAKCLAREGRLDIYLLCNASKKLPQEDDLGDVKVFRLGYFPRLGAKLNRILNYPLWFNPRWLLWGLQVARKVRPHYIHIHDLPLFYLGYLLSKITGAKLIYDLHENYPATFDLWRKGGLLRPIVRNKRLAMAYDRWSLRKADGVIVVEPEHKNWIHRRYKISKDITIVPNTVEVNEYPHFHVDSEIANQFKERFVLTYVGKLSVERDLDVAIRAMPTIREKIPNILLLIVGEGPDRLRLEHLRDALHLEQVVHFTGWMPFAKTASYISISNVCIIPQGSNNLVDNGTPHKLYQYMSLGKPVLVSDAKALSRVVNETSCGLIFKSKDEKDFARVLLQLVRSKTPFGENGKKAVEKKYNWEMTSKELLRLYESLY